MKPEAWMDDAACAEVTPDIFFPEQGAPPIAQVRAICESCPVRLACLEYAETEHIAWGVWGGLTPSERRRLRRARS